MAEVTRYNAAAAQDQELAKRVWELLFKPAARLTPNEYADIYQVCGEPWRLIYQQNMRPKAA